MAGDTDVFELFQQIMELLQDDDTDERMRMLSKNPRYAADDPAAQYLRNKTTERR